MMLFLRRTLVRLLILFGNLQISSFSMPAIMAISCRHPEARGTFELNCRGLLLRERFSTIVFFSTKQRCFLRQHDKAKVSIVLQTECRWLTAQAVPNVQVSDTTDAEVLAAASPKKI